MAVWRSLPLYLIVLEELERLARRRSSTVVREDELFDAVRKAAKLRGFEVSKQEFLKALMVLEMRGYVYVATVSDRPEKGRIIELLKTPHGSIQQG